MSLLVFDLEVPKYLHGIMIGVPPWYQGLAADRSLPRAPPDHRLKQLNNNRLGIWHRAVAVLRYPKNPPAYFPKKKLGCRHPETWSGPTYFWNSQRDPKKCHGETLRSSGISVDGSRALVRS